MAYSLKKFNKVTPFIKTLGFGYIRALTKEFKQAECPLLIKHIVVIFCAIAEQGGEELVPLYFESLKDFVLSSGKDTKSGFRNVVQLSSSKRNIFTASPIHINGEGKGEWQIKISAKKKALNEFNNLIMIVMRNYTQNPIEWKVDKWKRQKPKIGKAGRRSSFKDMFLNHGNDNGEDYWGVDNLNNMYCRPFVADKLIQYRCCTYSDCKLSIELDGKANKIAFRDLGRNKQICCWRGTKKTNTVAGSSYSLIICGRSKDMEIQLLAINTQK